MCLFHKTEDAQLEIFRKVKQISCQKGSYGFIKKINTHFVFLFRKLQTFESLKWTKESRGDSALVGPLVY